MDRLLWVGRGALVLGLLVSWTFVARAQEPLVTADPVRVGRGLFERDWRAAGPLHPDSDGLGPMFNAVSCAACHKQGGVGGAGPNENNVDLLSLAPKAGSTPARREMLRTNAAKLHPGLAQASTLILHNFGPADDYEGWRSDLLQKLNLKRVARGGPVPQVGLVSLQRSQRSTPALFGAGLIDSIPDAVLIEAAERQAESEAGISGRVPQTGTGAVGRFGWRGQTADLRTFVLTACAVELGLQVPGHEQTPDPRAPVKPRKGMLDLTQSECDALIAYVANLPAPKRALQSHLQNSLDAHKGRKMFATLGCAACHLPNLGDVEGIYSDLLLHDMGTGLSDLVAAVPELTTASGGFSSSYYGSSIDLNLVQATTNVRQEWRTPPLWGVASSAPYLHDGRAKTLDEAIRLHGGEGEAAADRYKELDPAEQAVVQRFLQSLVSPETKTPAASQFGFRF